MPKADFPAYPGIENLPSFKRFYREALVEPHLVSRAVELDTTGSEPIAVPVGKVRKGGYIEFGENFRDATDTCAFLRKQAGFPNARVVKRQKRSRRFPALYALRWGAPPPFDGESYNTVLGEIMLGLYYGYTDKAIADHLMDDGFVDLDQFDGGRAGILEIIRRTRNPR